jgi:hypothetical protein
VWALGVVVDPPRLHDPSRRARLKMLKHAAASMQDA